MNAYVQSIIIIYDLGNRRDLQTSYPKKKKKKNRQVIPSTVKSVCFYLSSEGIWTTRAHSQDWDLSWGKGTNTSFNLNGLQTTHRQKHAHNQELGRTCASSASPPFLLISFPRFAMFSSPLINDSTVVITDPESSRSRFVIVGTLNRHFLSKVPL